MPGYWNIFHSCILNICVNHFAVGIWLENFIAKFYHLNVENPIFFHVFDPKWVEVVQLKGNFGVIGKPIPTFKQAVHWSDFDILKTVFSQIDKTWWKTQVRQRGQFGNT